MNRKLMQKFRLGSFAFLSVYGLVVLINSVNWKVDSSFISEFHFQVIVKMATFYESIYYSTHQNYEINLESSTNLLMRTIHPLRVSMFSLLLDSFSLKNATRF